MPLTFGSLFAGIGGMDLGLERAGLICKWQVELNEYCREVLTKHWPNVPKYRDIRNANCGGGGNDSHPSTLSPAASPAKTLATPATARALKAVDRDFGGNTSESFANYDHASSSWKMSPPCLETEWEEFSATWPQSGTMRNGQCYPRVPWVDHICDGACSFLPTLRRSGQSRAQRVYRRTVYHSNLEEFLGEQGYSGWINTQWLEIVMGFPITFTEPKRWEMPLFQTLLSLSDAEF